MGHDVFISYSFEDKLTADAVCATLEARHIRCWVAPRDVLPGRVYAEQLMEAIRGATLMVLVFSSSSNGSQHVMREVERAASRGIPILPLRIEDVTPSASMEYYISDTHWLDAFTPPLGTHLGRLADTVTVLLDRTRRAAEDSGSAPPTDAPAVAEAVPAWYRRLPGRVALGIGALAVVAAVVLAAVLSGRDDKAVVDQDLTTGMATSTTTVAFSTTTVAPSATTSPARVTTSSTAAHGALGAIAPASPNTWTDLEPTGDLPPARSGHALAYDPTAGKAFLFGGEDVHAWYNDTWAYDCAGNAWTDQAPVGDVPSGRSWISMAYDPVGGKVILFGGWDGATCLNDTWAYDPAANTWTDLDPAGPTPPARCGCCLLYDPVDGKFVLFAGWDGSRCLADTWAYDPAVNAWAEMTAAGDAPSPRYRYALTYDSAAGRAILFGGWDDSNYLDDTWAYDPDSNKWTNLDPAGAVPRARHRHSMVYDQVSGTVILFGGWDGTACLDDTWQYDPVENTWTDLKPENHLPSARNLFAMVYDQDSDRVLLFGGWGGVIALGDTWAYAPPPTTTSTTTTSTTTTTVHVTPGTQIEVTTTAQRPPTTLTTRPPATTTESTASSPPPTFSP